MCKKKLGAIMHSLNKPQLKALIQAVKDPTKRLMVKIAYNHGLRSSEVCDLLGKNIQDGMVSVRRLKGSNKTVQPFIQSNDPDFDESVELTKLAGTLKPNELLFPGISRFNFNYAVKAAGKKAGIPLYLAHPHCLKHSCAMAMIRGGVEYTKAYLGHKSGASTLEYLKVSDKDASQVAKDYL